MIVKLNTIDKVKNFVNITSRFDDAIDVSTGRFMVDGKSILGLFSLDLSKPLQVVTYGGKQETDILRAVAGFAE